MAKKVHGEESPSIREEVLRLLKKEKGRFVSGEEISADMGISRTAVWKHIQALREEGYDIISLPRQGHQLVAVPDRLYPREVKEGLATAVIGRRYHYYPVVDSTNAVVRKLAAEGEEEGTVVAAEEQTGGRGRLGRSWFSPPGSGLWFSLLLRPALLPREVPRLTLVAGLATAKGIAKTTGLEVRLKWPNDLYLDGRKLGGILTEMEAELDRVHFVVVGIGLNVNVGEEEWPPSLRGTAISLREACGREIPRVSLLQAILRELDDCYRRFLAGEFPALLQEWRQRAYLRCPVFITLGGEKRRVEAVDVDEEGMLLVRNEDGEISRVVAGDVELVQG